MAEGDSISRWLFSKNWERGLFVLVGLAFLAGSLYSLYERNLLATSALFVLCVFSFVYSNVSRFKRFKGFGFEAELWEDKQKEAANLIDRLKSIIAVYSREIVMSSVMRNRWGGGNEWKSRWALFDEIVHQHDELGQDIDFSDLKRKVDSVFIFDICTPLASSVRQSIDKCRSNVMVQLQQEFGSPVTDLEGWNAKHEKLRNIVGKEEDLFERVQTENIAKSVLFIVSEAERKFKEGFGVEPEFSSSVIERLEKLSRLCKKRPLEISEELIEWAEAKVD